MNFIVKFLLDSVVLPADKALVNQLTVNRDANIAILQSDVTAGVATVDSAVTNFVLGKIKASPLVTTVVALVDQAYTSQIPAALAGIEDTVPAKYDALVAFLVKQEQYL